MGDKAGDKKNTKLGGGHSLPEQLGGKLGHKGNTNPEKTQLPGPGEASWETRPKKQGTKLGGTQEQTLECFSVISPW